MLLGGFLIVLAFAKFDVCRKTRGEDLFFRAQPNRRDAIRWPNSFNAEGNDCGKNPVCLRRREGNNKSMAKLATDFIGPIFKLSTVLYFDQRFRNK